MCTLHIYKLDCRFGVYGFYEIIIIIIIVVIILVIIILIAISISRAPRKYQQQALLSQAPSIQKVLGLAQVYQAPGLRVEASEIGASGGFRSSGL